MGNSHGHDHKGLDPKDLTPVRVMKPASKKAAEYKNLMMNTMSQGSMKFDESDVSQVAIQMGKNEWLGTIHFFVEKEHVKVLNGFGIMDGHHLKSVVEMSQPNPADPAEAESVFITRERSGVLKIGVNMEDNTQNPLVWVRRCLTMENSKVFLDGQEFGSY
eukprot:316283_1